MVDKNVGSSTELADIEISTSRTRSNAKKATRNKDGDYDPVPLSDLIKIIRASLSAHKKKKKYEYYSLRITTGNN